MAGKGDITPLIPWLNEPYRQERVYAAVKSLGFPCILREVVQQCGLPAYIVHTRLTRLVKQGRLVRRKTRMTYDHVTGGQGGPRGVRWRPGGMQRRVYLYSIPSEAGAE